MSVEQALSDYRMVDLRGIDWSEIGSNRTASGVRVTPETALQCSAFLACVRVISETVASLPLFVYERLADGGKQKASSLPLYRLLHTQPNPWQTAMEWREQMTALYLMYGNSYAEIRPGTQGRVSELWPLHPSRMEVERLENGRLRYLYREPDGRQTVYTQDQIFHLRWLSTDGVLGLQPPTLSRDAIGLARALEQHGSTYFGNGARPGIVLESDNPIPVEAAERLRESWERMHRGADRAHRTAVLPNGVKAKELSGSNEAAQFLETRRFQIEEVARSMRCPLHLIGELSRSTYNNIEVQNTEAVQFCWLPHCRRWEAAISRDLIDDDETFFAEHVLTGLLRGDHVSRSAYYVSAIQNGWMSVNEVRELENMNPLGEEGDQHMSQLNMTTLDKIGQAQPLEPEQGEPETPDGEPELVQPAAEEGEPQLAEVSLNGAQISSLLEILTKMNEGLLSAEASKALILAAFPSLPPSNVDAFVAGTNTQVLVEPVEQDERQVSQGVPEAQGFAEGDYVTWGGGEGRIEHIMVDGVLGVEGSAFAIPASEDEPAALVRIYQGGNETEMLVGKRLPELTQENEPDGT
jgi:HK97 family phage portal protein